MSVQRFTIALQNRLFLRFHLLSPVADGLRGGWSSPDLRPLFRWDLSHDTSPFGLPESAAVSILGHVLSPFPSTLNFLRTSINNVREVFGCWCSLFCQMFKASRGIQLNLSGTARVLIRFTLLSSQDLCLVKIQSRKNAGLFICYRR